MDRLDNLIDVTPKLVMRCSPGEAERHDAIFLLSIFTKVSHTVPVMYSTVDPHCHKVFFSSNITLIDRVMDNTYRSLTIVITPKYPQLSRHFMLTITTADHLQLTWK